MRIGIVQSCYIPWRGYFDLIQRCDRFILYDCVQYTARDWRNRNRIKTVHGPLWLTIPVKHESRQQRICDTVTLNDEWKQQHWDSIRHAYAHAPYFDAWESELQLLYEQCSSHALSDINLHFLSGIARLLNIATPMEILREPVSDAEDKTQKLVDICVHYGADTYLSGLRAQAYLDSTRFPVAGIKVEWMNYDYPEYEQPYPPFRQDVSIMDYLVSHPRGTRPGSS